MTEKERACSYDIEVEVSQLNKNGILKPYAYQVLFADVASRHLNYFHANADDLLPHGMSWVLISLQLEISRNVNGCEHLNAETWHSGTKGPYFRREFIFRGEDGEIVFRGSTFSVLLDVKKRSVVRPKYLPIELPAPDPEITIDAAATRRIDMDYELCDTRRVYPSYIDVLGHVNNCRYGEFAYDSFNPDEVENLKNLKRMEVYFEHELTMGDTFSVSKAKSGSTVFVRGWSNESDAKSFDIVMEF